MNVILGMFVALKLCVKKAENESLKNGRIQNMCDNSRPLPNVCCFCSVQMSLVAKCYYDLLETHALSLTQNNLCLQRYEERDVTLNNEKYKIQEMSQRKHN